MGLRYAMLNLVKFALLFIAVMSLCVYALKAFSDSVCIEADYRRLVLTGVCYLAPFMLLPVIAFFAGGFAPGDPIRLLWRIVMCLFMAAFLLMLSDGMSYELHGLVLDSCTGATADSVSLTVMPKRLSMMLAIIPLLSGVDSVLEYLEPSTTKGWQTKDA